MMPPTPGRVVHYLTKFSEIRPAIVIEVVGDRCCLHVFLKPSDRLHMSDYQPLVPFSITPQRETWHWPDRAAANVPQVPLADTTLPLTGERAVIFSEPHVAPGGAGAGGEPS